MAIDPYEPELAKRQKAFEIGSQQLSRLMNLNLSNRAKGDFIETWTQTTEALRDYAQAGKDLAEWLAQKQPNR